MGNIQKNRLYIALNSLLAFFLFITSNTVYWVSRPYKGKIAVLFLIVLGIAFLVAIYNLSHRYKISHKYYLCIITYLFFMALFFIRNMSINSISRSKLVLYIFFPITIFTWIYFQHERGTDIDLLVSFKNIVLIFSLISLPMYILVSILHINSNMIINVNWGRYHPIVGYFGLLFNTQGSETFLGINMFRNTGIFTEAPMHSFVLIIALLITLFIEKAPVAKKKRVLDLTLLMITLLTTTSTTGLFIAILAFYFYLYKRVPSRFKLIFIVVIPFIFIALSILLSQKYANAYGSFSVRMDDIRASYRAWQDHLLLGNGWLNESAIKQYMMTSRLVSNGNSGLSSGLFASLALSGLLQTSLLFFIPYVAYAILNKGYVFSILLLVLLINAIVDGTFIMLAISMFLYVQIVFSGKHRSRRLLFKW